MLHIHYKSKDGCVKNFITWKILEKRKYKNQHIINFVFNKKNSYTIYCILYIYTYILYRITLKDIKSFLPRIHCKISTSKLRELFQELDIRKRNELSFDEFVALYNKLIFNSGV